MSPPEALQEWAAVGLFFLAGTGAVLGGVAWLFHVMVASRFDRWEFLLAHHSHEGDAVLAPVGKGSDVLAPILHAGGEGGD